MFLKLYFMVLPLLLVLDIAWLNLTKDFYKKQIGFLIKANPNLISAAAFYFVFAAGLVFFVILPIFGKHQVGKAFFGGAFFGLVCYATYDLTNLATVKNWPVLVTVVDLLWGAALGAIISISCYYIALKLGW
jgi:uncharacterized membrane protein